MPKQRTSRSSKAKSPYAVDKCPTGIEGLDEILSGGLPCGAPTLFSGGPGCGKTLFGLEFVVRGAQKFGDRGVFISFEENAEELARNVASCGIDLMKFVKSKQIFVDYIQI